MRIHSGSTSVFLCLLLALFSLSSLSAAAKVERYSGEARSEDGELVYTEKHEVKLDGKNVKTATTRYFDAEGKLIGIMSSNFSKSLTSPEYTFEDKRHGDHHGIRIEDGRLFLFKIEEGKEEQKPLDKALSSSDLFVGCQGLHYYLKDNLSEVESREKVPVKFLIPGRLDYYSFVMNYDGRDSDGNVKLDVEVDNWFLRLFAPSLDVVYDPKTGRLVSYRGLSNIKNQRGKLQKVEIKYFYDEKS